LTGSATGQRGVSALVLIAATLVAGCSTPQGTLHRTTLALDSPSRMPVVLGDLTGLVVGIEPIGANLLVTGELPVIVNDQREPAVVMVSWATGICDEETALSFRSSASGGFSLELDIRERLSVDACPVEEVIRGIRIRFSQPMLAEGITLSGDGSDIRFRTPAPAP
jgi:hypothetical protein